MMKMIIFASSPFMRFRGRASFIAACLAHVINLNCKDFLASSKPGSAHEPQLIFESLSAQGQSSEGELSIENAVVKICLLVLWLSNSPQRKKAWKEVLPSKQISYDVDTVLAGI
jgi:hypothetical protein